MKNEEQKQRLDKWHKTIDDYLKSGMTQKIFCEQNNLSLPQLVYYYGQFKRDKESSTTKPAFLPVNIPSREKVSVITQYDGRFSKLINGRIGI
jgi:hypothetical protein